MWWYVLILMIVIMVAMLMGRRMGGGGIAGGGERVKRRIEVRVGTRLAKELRRKGIYNNSRLAGEDPYIIVAEGAQCVAAMGAQRTYPMMRGMVLVNPEADPPGMMPGNVIAHGKLPMGAERYYQHIVEDGSGEAVAQSVRELMGF
jgi:hypothetical protein